MGCAAGADAWPDDSAGRAPSKGLSPRRSVLCQLDLPSQCGVPREPRQTLLPDVERLLLLADLLVHVAQEEVALGEARLGVDPLLLGDQDLEVLDRLARATQPGRPVGERDGLGEARVPVARIQLERDVEGLIRLVGPYPGLGPLPTSMILWM